MSPDSRSATSIRAAILGREGAGTGCHETTGRILHAMTITPARVGPWSTALRRSNIRPTLCICGRTVECCGRAASCNTWVSASRAVAVRRAVCTRGPRRPTRTQPCHATRKGSVSRSVRKRSGAKRSSSHTAVEFHLTTKPFDVARRFQTLEVC